MEIVDSLSSDPVIVDPLAGRVGPPNTPVNKGTFVVFEGVLVWFVAACVFASREGDSSAKPMDGPGL